MTPRDTMKMEPMATFTHMDYWMEDPENIAVEFIKQHQVKDIIKVRMRLKSDGVIFRGIITCVSIVKAAMGIKAWWVMTPQQLRRYLLRHGGKSLKPKKEGIGSGKTR